MPVRRRLSHTQKRPAVYTVAGGLKGPIQTKRHNNAQRADLAFGDESKAEWALNGHVTVSIELGQTPRASLHAL
eukprot:665995-Amphidinium_carterae.2